MEKSALLITSRDPPAVSMSKKFPQHTFFPIGIRFRQPTSILYRIAQKKTYPKKTFAQLLNLKIQDFVFFKERRGEWGDLLRTSSFELFLLFHALL